MHKILIRAFVLALTMTGFAAAIHSSAAPVNVTMARVDDSGLRPDDDGGDDGYLPIPVCAPGDPNGCGISDH